MDGRCVREREREKEREREGGREEREKKKKRERERERERKRKRDLEIHDAIFIGLLKDIKDAHSQIFRRSQCGLRHGFLSIQIKTFP